MEVAIHDRRHWVMHVHRTSASTLDIAHDAVRASMHVTSRMHTNAMLRHPRQCVVLLLPPAMSVVHRVCLCILTNLCVGMPRLHASYASLASMLTNAAAVMRSTRSTYGAVKLSRPGRRDRNNSDALAAGGSQERAYHEDWQRETTNAWRQKEPHIERRRRRKEEGKVNADQKTR